MKAAFLNQYISDHAIKAICWTLLHSLWIGIVVAALAGLVIALTKKSPANLRYRLLCGILMLFITATTFTFFAEWAKPVNNITVINLSTNATGQTIISTTNADVTIDGFNYTRVVSFFDQYSAWVFAAWLLCFALKSARLTRELLYVKRVRSVGVFDIGPEWKDKVSAFSQKLGIMRGVSIKESKLINVPVTVGYLKPIILLPAGMILQLSPGQIESVIYHELAHILRRDYLVNIMQSVVETVFFFNPAIWWISALIREERETCCDDIVLAHVPQKRSYLEALMIFQEYESDKSSYAMALSLRKNQLMKRLRRMVSHENQKLSAAEKIVLLSGMVFLLLFTFVPKANSEVRHGASFIKKQVMAVVSNITPHHVLPPPPAGKKAHAPKLHIDTLKKSEIIGQLTDTLPKLVRVQFNKTNADSLNREVTVTDDANNHYYFKIENKKLVAFIINDMVIPPAEFSHYQPLLNHINQMIANAHSDKERKSKDRMQLLSDEHDREIAKVNVKWQKQKARDAEVRVNDNAHNAKDKVRNDRDNAAAKDRHTSDDNDNVIEIRNENNSNFMVLRDGNTGNTLKLSKSKNRKGDLFVKPRLDIDEAASKKHNDKPRPDYDAKPRSGDTIRAKKKHHTDISVDQQRVRGVIAALVAEKIVTDASSVDWFGLCDEELVVNGAKQPEALHQKLKNQYSIKPNNGLYYGPVKMNGTGVFLDKQDL